jgi:hypothetical protein
MLTKHPNIVIALPPKRSARRKKATVLHADTPRIVEAKKTLPQYKAAQVDPVKAGEAFDRLWQGLIREVNAQRDQPAPDRGKNKRGRSGQ